MGTFTKGIAGVEDIQFKSSGTTRQTFTRADAAGRTLTLNQVDGADIQFRTLAKSIDDLVDGGYDVAIKPQYIFGGGNNTNGHTVPNAADDVFVLRDTDETITGDKVLSGANTISGALAISGVTTFTGTRKGDKGADVASEATLFDAAGFPTDGNYFDVTGVTGITAITTSGQVGTVIELHFDGILTITQDGTNIVHPGDKDITTKAGTELTYKEYSTGDWRLIGGNYTFQHDHSDTETGGALSSGMVQQVHTQTGAVATGATQMPFDDTIPQNTEGDEYMTLAITPTSATNKLLIESVIHLAHSSAAISAMMLALFQDATANALAVAWELKLDSANGICQINLRHEMVAGTIASTTFKIRAGASGAGTTTFNGQAAARLYGGILASSLRISEVKV